MTLAQPAQPLRVCGPGTASRRHASQTSELALTRTSSKTALSPGCKLTCAMIPFRLDKSASEVICTVEGRHGVFGWTNQSQPYFYANPHQIGPSRAFHTKARLAHACMLGIIANNVEGHVHLQTRASIFYQGNVHQQDTCINTINHGHVHLQTWEKVYLNTRLMQDRRGKLCDKLLQISPMLGAWSKHAPPKALPAAAFAQRLRAPMSKALPHLRAYQ